MAPGQGQQPQGSAPTCKEAVLRPAEGNGHPVDLIFGNEEQEAIIGTVWREMGRAWKVNDIHVKKQP